MNTLRTWRDDQPECPACTGVMRAEHGDLTYELEDYTITVTNVPMHVCPDCGERLVPGPVGLIVGELVQKFIEQISEVERSRNMRHAPTTALSIEYANQEVDPNHLALA